MEAPQQPMQQEQQMQASAATQQPMQIPVIQPSAPPAHSEPAPKLGWVRYWAYFQATFIIITLILLIFAFGVSVPGWFQEGKTGKNMLASGAIGLSFLAFLATFWVYQYAWKCDTYVNK